MGFSHNQFEIGNHPIEQKSAPSSYPVNFKHLENGLTVLHQYIPLTPIVAVDVWVNAGVIHEPHTVPGLAHVLEHMIFKGTATISPREFDRLLEQRGGIVNAATAHDYAHFYMITVANQLEESFSQFADLVINATIPDSEFTRELEVILAEIDQAYDDPDWVVYQSVRQLLFPDHPYGRPVLGLPELPPLLSAADTRAFHHQQYCPENMTIVMIGDLSQAQAMTLVEKHCHWQQTSMVKTTSITWAQPNPLNHRKHQALTAPGLKQARLMMAWLGPGVDQTGQGYGLDLLSVLLTGGRTSRLIADLLETRGWIQDIHSEFLLQKAGGCFTLSILLDPDYLEVVETVICEHLYQLRETCIPEEELHRCQQLVVNDFIFGTETVNQLAGLYGYYNSLGNLEQALSYPHLIQAIEPEHLQHLAQSYLSPNHYAVTTLQPLSC